MQICSYLEREEFDPAKFLRLLYHNDSSGVFRNFFFFFCLPHLSLQQHFFVSQAFGDCQQKDHAIASAATQLHFQSAIYPSVLDSLLVCQRKNSLKLSANVFSKADFHHGVPNASDGRNEKVSISTVKYFPMKMLNYLKRLCFFFFLSTKAARSATPQV